MQSFMQVSLQSITNSAVSVDKNLLSPDIYDFINIDSGVLIHSFSGTTAQDKTFDSCFDKVFCLRVCHDLNRSTKVDVVWDQYRALEIKGSAREKRETGLLVHLLVLPQSQKPGRIFCRKLVTRKYYSHFCQKR